MAKAIPDAILDGMLQTIRGFADVQDACSAEPANYAGISAVSLASTAMTVNTDYTQANGDTSGRKITVAQKTGVSVTATDDATHLVLHNGSDTMYAVTTCGTTSLTSGNTVTFNAWDIEILDVA